MHGDAFTPEELALLGRVFDRCAPTVESKADWEIFALRIISRYRSGITDEAKLIELCREADAADLR